MIAQYSPALLLLWNGHCHIDIAISQHTFVYMFKYVSKGPDYARYRVNPSNNDADNERFGDDYINARYLSTTEAAWRISGKPLTSKDPSVKRLAVHGPRENRPQFHGSKHVGSDASTLIRYFLRPNQYSHTRYIDYYEQTTMKASTASQRNDPSSLASNQALEKTEPGSSFYPNIITPRSRRKSVARIKSVRPSAGDAFYIRAILLNRAASSWNDLKRSPDGTIHSTFQQAAEYEGLTESDEEPVQALQEAIRLHKPPAELRFLFALLTVEGASAQKLWTAEQQSLSRDFLPYNHEFQNAPPQTVNQALQSALNDLDDIFQSFGLSNESIGLPKPSQRSLGSDEEQAYFNAQATSLRAQASASFSRFTPHQQSIYTEIIQAITDPNLSAHKFHLIQGRAGRGKSFLIQAIINNLRGNGYHITVCGATGLAAASFDRATTVHKRFAIPVFDDDGEEREKIMLSTMRTDSSSASYIRSSSAIFIDEIWALPRAILEAVDDLMRRINENDEPFGGIPLIGVGDPRQTAPVTRENTKQATLENSIITSELFHNFRIHELQQSQRQASDIQFSDWIDTIGDDDSGNTVQLNTMIEPIETLEASIEFLFPADVLANAEASQKRCFLTPINSTIEHINEEITRRIPQDEVSAHENQNANLHQSLCRTT
ncbi:hypothetical protein CF319_g7503 [Tilletia indica]|nr:hypothetical protein CF319_g7503 [Tilletia indica]